MKLGPVAVALVLAVAACAQPSPDAERSADATSRAREFTAEADHRSPAFDLGRRFLATYVDAGRVVRAEHGGDTVSEGQAYGMLIAAAIGDRAQFASIWDWTRANLQRDDGLLSWRWMDGAVVDPMPAADADLDAAHALAIAADRFEDPAFADDAARLAAAIVDHEVVVGAEGPVLVAGPWARDDRWVNPSYASPAAFAALDALSDDPAWSGLDDAGRRIVAGSTMGSDLPSDWARLRPEAIEPVGAPAGGPPQHGYDAGRVAIRWAVDCEDAGVALAASLRDEYVRVADAHGRPPAVLALDGSRRADHGSPLLTVAHAAAAHADGDAPAAARLLDEAAGQAREHPSYYGDAWAALGRLWLTTDRLGGCALR